MHLQHLSLVAGEDRVFNLLARDPDQSLTDLTDAVIEWRLARKAGEGPLLTKSGSIMDAALGSYSVSLGDGETGSLSGIYLFQTKATQAGITRTVTSGRLRVREGF